MDKSRKQFEAWLVRNHSDTCNNINFEINSKGDYRYFSTRLAWGHGKHHARVWRLSYLANTMWMMSMIISQLVII